MLNENFPTHRDLVECWVKTHFPLGVYTVVYALDWETEESNDPDGITIQWLKERHLEIVDLLCAGAYIVPGDELYRMFPEEPPYMVLYKDGILIDENT